MEESKIREVISEEIDNKLGDELKDMRSLLSLNLELSTLLLTGISGTKEFEGPRRQVITLLERVKNKMEAMAKKIGENKDDR